MEDYGFLMENGGDGGCENLSPSPPLNRSPTSKLGFSMQRLSRRDQHT